MDSLLWIPPELQDCTTIKVKPNGDILDYTDNEESPRYKEAFLKWNKHDGTLRTVYMHDIEDGDNIVANFSLLDDGQKIHVKTVPTMMSGSFRNMKNNNNNNNHTNNNNNIGNNNMNMNDHHRLCLQVSADKLTLQSPSHRTLQIEPSSTAASLCCGGGGLWFDVLAGSRLVANFSEDGNDGSGSLQMEFLQTRSNGDKEKDGPVLKLLAFILALSRTWRHY